jgi:hypothetical protein
MTDISPARSLEEAKERLRTLLGRGPIHGLGLRRAENAVYVYVHPKVDIGVEPVLTEARRVAAPFKVVVVKEEQPKASL